MSSGTEREWLIGLRWGLLAVAALVLGVVQLGSGGLPWVALLGLLAVGAVSNAVLAVTRPVWLGADGVLAATLVGDGLGLTLFLALSGGANNPFSFLYLLLVVEAALVLSPTRTAALTVGIGAAYGVLFALPEPPHDPAAMERHLQGMWVAYAVCAPLLAVAVHQLRARAAAAEAHRRAAEASAERANRLASLATLAAGAAHEIATPLSTIAVIAGDLARHGEDGVRQDAALLAAEVERCRLVLHQLAADAGTARVDGLRDVAVGELVAGLSAEVRVDAAAGSLRVRSSGLLVQALRRLVDNGVQAGPPVIVSVAPDAEGVRIDIRDHGPGLRPADLARIGEPFFTTHGGLGLGVWFSSNVVRQLGGELAFRSGPGGTTATVSLPVVAP